jgi:hypothetical protein
VTGFDKVFGSLVLGGYDASKFSPTGDITFPFYEDIERKLLVGIQKITTDAGSTTLMSDGIFSFIDSTIPHIWLPQSACSAFEKAFGLTWNDTAQLYLVDSKTHDSLLKQNPNITFTIGPQKSGGSTIDIVFPYAAFDLNVSYPYVQGNSYYFPLKRAANDTQYTLGRTFLQEAYLITDYERSNFSVWPVKWDQNAKSSIVAIRSINDTSSPNNSNGGGPNNPSSPSGNNKSGIGAGAIAGIVVGVVVLALLALLIWWLQRTGRLALSLKLKKKRSFELDGANTLPSTAGDQEAGTPAAAGDKKVDGIDGGHLDSGEIHELHTHHKFGLLEAPSGVDAYAKMPEMEADIPLETLQKQRNQPIYEMEGTTGGWSSDQSPRQQPESKSGTPAPPTPGQIEAVWRSGTPKSTTETGGVVSRDASTTRGPPSLPSAPSPPIPNDPAYYDEIRAAGASVSPPLPNISPPTVPPSPGYFDQVRGRADGRTTPRRSDTMDSEGICVPLRREASTSEAVAGAPGPAQGVGRGRGRGMSVERYHVEEGGLDR